jgi:hypothetical integral membrane protein (TIGR02206 family)
VTPNLARGFPDARFINFFALHGGVIAAALYMTLCLGMRPVPMSIARFLAWSMAYLAIAMVANSMLGANFCYLRMKPTHPSLLDYMAPWLPPSMKALPPPGGCGPTLSHHGLALARHRGQ